MNPVPKFTGQISVARSASDLIIHGTCYQDWLHVAFEKADTYIVVVVARILGRVHKYFTRVLKRVHRLFREPSYSLLVFFHDFLTLTSVIIVYYSKSCQRCPKHAPLARRKAWLPCKHALWDPDIFQWAQGRRNRPLLWHRCLRIGRHPTSSVLCVGYQRRSTGDCAIIILPFFFGFAHFSFGAFVVKLQM